MTIGYLMDANIHGAITRGLRARAVHVVTAQEDGSDSLPDPALLDRAGSLGLVLVSHDVDFLVEGNRRLQAGERFDGIVFIRQLSAPIGRCIDDLEVFAKLGEPAEWIDRIEYLPL